MAKFIGYKVIEERISPSSRIEYYTLPRYQSITEDEISGKILFETKETSIEHMLKKYGVEYKEDEFGKKKYIHVFTTYESALEYMVKYFKGYMYIRPIIYECECNIENIPSADEITAKCNSIKFLKPITQMVNFKVNEYVKMTLPERKKTRGFAYNEDDINGDTDYNEE